MFNESKPRELWADYAKAIAIWLMVFAHVGISRNVQTVIHVFHMPLFFYVAGYFDKGSLGIVEIVRKNIRYLMVPYFCFSLFSLTFAWQYPYKHPEFYPRISTLSEYIKVALMGIIRMEDKVLPGSFLPNLALWFLPCLFLVKLLFALLCKIKQHYSFNNAYWGVLLILPVLIFPYLIPINWFSVDSAFMALPLYIVGYLSKEYKLVNYIQKRKSVLLIVTLLYTAFLAPMNDMVNMDGGYAGNNIFFFYFNAIVGILMIISFVNFNIFTPNGLVAYIGKNTLVVLGLHLLFISFYKLFAYMIFDKINDMTALIISILVIVSLIPVIKFINKYIPFVIGKVK